MKSPLQIKVLGELAVLRDAQEVVLPASKKTRALLAYLAVVNRRQRRDHLCQMFWDAPDDPRASLRWSLSKLKRAIDPDDADACIRADRDSVFLDSGSFDLDLSHVIHIRIQDVRSLDTATLLKLAGEFRGRFLGGLDLSRRLVFEAWRTFHADALDRTRSLNARRAPAQRAGESAAICPSAAVDGSERRAGVIESNRIRPAGTTRNRRFVE